MARASAAWERRLHGRAHAASGPAPLRARARLSLQNPPRAPPPLPHPPHGRVVAKDELDTLLAHPLLGAAAPLLLLANKSDLPSALGPAEIAQARPGLVVGGDSRGGLILVAGTACCCRAAACPRVRPRGFRCRSGGPGFACWRRGEGRPVIMAPVCHQNITCLPRGGAGAAPGGRSPASVADRCVERSHRRRTGRRPGLAGSPAAAAMSRWRARQVLEIRVPRGAGPWVLLGRIPGKGVHMSLLSVRRKRTAPSS